ncbi:hypothetical protein [Sphingosinithalassobacter sp. LHW66-3]|uniref:hypothetical protein n=1 Tax=Sphingosinithalassobacter sp. LHW66-3 TaxID=3424718 RepID=UPI003D6C42A9
MIALLRAVSGLIVWAVAFSALYGLQGLVCAAGWQATRLGPLSLGRAMLVLLWLGFLALLAWMSWRFAHGSRDFLGLLAIGLALVGLVATAYTGAPVLAGSICL